MPPAALPSDPRARPSSHSLLVVGGSRGFLCFSCCRLALLGCPGASPRYRALRTRPARRPRFPFGKGARALETGVRPRCHTEGLRAGAHALRARGQAPLGWAPFSVASIVPSSSRSSAPSYSQPVLSLSPARKHGGARFSPSPCSRLVPLPPLPPASCADRARLADVGPHGRPQVGRPGRREKEGKLARRGATVSPAKVPPSSFPTVSSLFLTGRLDTGGFHRAR